jgi:hypothetical protein
VGVNEALRARIEDLLQGRNDTPDREPSLTR